MADYDDKSLSVAVTHVTLATLTATPAVTGLDTLGYGSVTFSLYAGIGGITFTGTNRIDYIVSESDDNATFSAAGDDALILDPGAAAPGGTGIVRSLIAAKSAADSGVIATVGYRGKKRYVKCVPTFSGTHGTGTPVAVGCRLGHAYHGPVGAANIEV